MIASISSCYLALLSYTCCESILFPQSYAMKLEPKTRQQRTMSSINMTTRQITAFAKKLSVGSLSVLVWSLSRDFTGRALMIAYVIKGVMIPQQTQILGALEQSLNRQQSDEIMDTMTTTKVPGPMSKIRPQQISRFPVEARLLSTSISSSQISSQAATMDNKIRALARANCSSLFIILKFKLLI